MENHGKHKSSTATVAYNKSSNNKTCRHATVAKTSRSTAGISATMALLMPLAFGGALALWPSKDVNAATTSMLHRQTSSVSRTSIMSPASRSAQREELASSTISASLKEHDKSSAMKKNADNSSVSSGMGSMFDLGEGSQIDVNALSRPVPKPELQVTASASDATVPKPSSPSSASSDWTPSQDLSLDAATVKASWENVPTPAGFNPNHATGDIGNAYRSDQCTYWAYVRRKQLGMPVGSHFGDGWMWASSAEALGYWVDNVPHIGDIASFERGFLDSDTTYGHVAIVEKVLDDGGIVTSESGSVFDGKPQSRTIHNLSGIRFVHF